MAINQLWTINGQTYNHQQLMELRKQGFNPLKDKVEMKKVTKHEVEITEEIAEEYPELEEQGVEVGDTVQAIDLEDVPMAELRKAAKLKGMKATPKTTKAEFIAYLKA